MKFSNFAFAFLLIPALSGCAQQNKTPQAVQDAFDKLYPDVKSEKWEKEGDNYEAEFDQKGVEVSVVFDAAGNHLETETEIKESELPAGVIEYITTNYGSAKIQETEQIVAGTTITYEVEIKDKEGETEMIFDSNGAFVKVVKEDDDEEGDDDDDK